MVLCKPSDLSLYGPKIPMVNANPESIVEHLQIFQIDNRYMSTLCTVFPAVWMMSSQLIQFSSLLSLVYKELNSSKSFKEIACILQRYVFYVYFCEYDA